MRELAAFASSASGKTYAQVCQLWGTDPAAFLEPVDDVGAYNLRAALAMSLSPESPEDTMDPNARDHLDSVARAHRANEELRARFG